MTPNPRESPLPSSSAPPSSPVPEPSHPRLRSPLGILALSLALLPGTSCTKHHPTAPEVSVAPPAHFRAAPEGSADPVETAPWWLAFDDPRLSSLIETAFGDNLNLRAAWSRLDQALAGARISKAQERPQSDVEISTGYTQFFFPGAGARRNDRSSVSAPVSWELDLFGKLNAATSASRLEAVATRQDLEALALSLSGQIASTYVGLLEQRARRKLLQAQVETNADLLDSLEVRFTQGQSSSLDYYQQEQLVQGRRAQLQLIEAEAARQENALAVLLGKAPGTLALSEEDELPALPRLPALGIPSDLLTRRPDLRAAFHRIEAADRRVAQAVRDRLPSVRLGLSFSYQTAYPGGLFEDLLRGVTGALATPLFDGGRRRSTIHQRQAQVEELLHRYSQSFLEALEEVETALAVEKQQQEYLAELEAQEETAQRTFELAQDRYQEGVEDFIRVLTALGSLQTVQDSLVQGRALLLRNRIQLCRALGGAWTRALPRDGLADPVTGQAPPPADTGEALPDPRPEDPVPSEFAPTLAEEATP